MQPVDFPAYEPVDPAVLFRRSAARCPAVSSWAAEAGRGTSGKPGWRHIATCASRAGRLPVRVDVGVSDDPAQPRWAGGTVIGTIGWAPQHASMIGRLWGGEGRHDPMIVADQPASGLEASIPPSAADIPNNHLSYAIQWFFFAATAAVIYALALRRRMIADRGIHR
jgi:cytochrome oxidase assembly protein ShyY1